jgi:ABC-type Zn2+ transport system substrate-binding protein/surface adhesin
MGRFLQAFLSFFSCFTCLKLSSALPNEDHQPPPSSGAAATAAHDDDDHDARDDADDADDDDHDHDGDGDDAATIVDPEDVVKALKQLTLHMEARLEQRDSSDQNPNAFLWPYISDIPALLKDLNKRRKRHGARITPDQASSA